MTEVTRATTSAARKAAAWQPSDAQDLYYVDAWSDGFFYVDEAGRVAVRTAPEGAGIAITDVVEHVADEKLTFPLLLRFQDVLKARVDRLNDAFRQAIEAFGYRGRYTGVYPIKVNQLHEVVEEVLEAGRPYGLGLECGSKAELIAALPHLEDDETLLICNGYKDEAMQRLILMGQELGRNVIAVVEKYDEFERLMALADELGVTPRFGVRVALATRGAGQWAESSGDQSKFGVSIPELLRLVEWLEARDRREAFVLLHFHLGSQISEIQTLKRAAKEVTQVYAQLRRRGLPLRYIDVGGGLGVNYETGISGRHEGINYTLQEYANSVVYAVQEVCDAEEVEHPTLVSESGRALTAHHSVLLVNVSGTSVKPGADADAEASDDDEMVVQELAGVLRSARALGEELGRRHAERLAGNLLEHYHDAVEKREEANTLFGLGYLPIEGLGRAERLFWAVCRTVHELASDLRGGLVPAELQELDAKLVDQYLCNFSVFQSILDHWAIGQRFPVMPVHRLDERPSRRGILVDLTCDSDGKVSRFIALSGEKHYLELHEPRPGEPYLLGFFLMGAYQDIMGDMHNLFGRVSEVHVYADEQEPEGFYIEKVIPGASVEEMLAQVQYSAADLHRRMRGLVRGRIEAGDLRPKRGMQLLDLYESAFSQRTYLKG